MKQYAHIELPTPTIEYHVEYRGSRITGESWSIQFSRPNYNAAITGANSYLQRHGDRWDWGTWILDSDNNKIYKRQSVHGIVTITVN